MYYITLNKDFKYEYLDFIYNMPKFCENTTINHYAYCGDFTPYEGYINGFRVTDIDTIPLDDEYIVEVEIPRRAIVVECERDLFDKKSKHIRTNEIIIKSIWKICDYPFSQEWMVKKASDGVNRFNYKLLIQLVNTHNDDNIKSFSFNLLLKMIDRTNIDATDLIDIINKCNSEKYSDIAFKLLKYYYLSNQGKEYGRQYLENIVLFHDNKYVKLAWNLINKNENYYNMLGFIGKRDYVCKYNDLAWNNHIKNQPHNMPFIHALIDFLKTMANDKYKNLAWQILNDVTEKRQFSIKWHLENLFCSYDMPSKYKELAKIKLSDITKQS